MNTTRTIPYGKKPKVLLLGNGIGRAFGTNDWEKMLAEMSSNSFDKYAGEDIESLPFPLQAIVLTDDNVDEGIDCISEKLIDSDVTDEQAEIIKQLVSLDFDVILTTNYTYEIEKSLDKSFLCKKGKASKYRKTLYTDRTTDKQFELFRFMEVAGTDIWHIHGEAALKNSMVLGHYFYGKLLAREQNYIHRVIQDYKEAEEQGTDYEVRSWIDYFLLGDLYIVGLGLDPSEMDLWWLLNCKKRHREELNQAITIWYEPNLNQSKNFAKRVLAKTIDMKIKTENVGKKGFKKYYKKITASL